MGRGKVRKKGANNPVMVACRGLCHHRVFGRITGEVSPIRGG
jgi:hypothetical protein